MNNNLHLFLDTSCPRAVLALARETTLIAEVFLDDKIKHGERIAQALDDVLTTAQISITEIHTIVVGNGPGAFVGTRLGLATAKGLAMALEIPLITINTLTALGASGQKIGKGMALADARRGEFYCQHIMRDAQGTHPLSDPFTLPYAELAERISGLDFITGFDFALGTIANTIVQEPFFGPTGQGMLNAFCVKNTMDDETYVAFPNYCREPDAKPLFKDPP